MDQKNGTAGLLFAPRLRELNSFLGVSCKPIFLKQRWKEPMRFMWTAMGMTTATKNEKPATG
jgi:hypothetical protein